MDSNSSTETDSTQARPQPGQGPWAFPLMPLPVIRLPIVRSNLATSQIESGLNYQFTADTVAQTGRQGDCGSISNVRIRGGKTFLRSTWEATYESNVFNREDSTRYETLIAGLGYRITYQWRIQALAGYDNGSSRWRITPVWTPSPAISVAVGYGERYSGKDWYLSLSRRFKRATLRAEYQRMWSDSRTEVLDEDVVQFEDVFSDPVRNSAFNHDVDVTPQAPTCDPLLLHDPRIRHSPTGLR